MTKTETPRSSERHMSRLEKLKVETHEALRRRCEEIRKSKQRAAICGKCGCDRCSGCDDHDCFAEANQ